MSALQEYLKKTSVEKVDPFFTAYLSGLQAVASVSPVIAAAIVNELDAQRNNLKLIASENYCSPATQLAMGNLLTDKYAEGFPAHRFYAGCDNIDTLESFACKQACHLFGAEHAYVQPHSGADANLIAFWAILNTKVETPSLRNLNVENPSKLTRKQWENLRGLLNNQRLLAMDYYSGGHLTHGYSHNVSSRMFDVYSYGVNAETGLIDYDAIEKQALEVQPLILLAGYSAYPRRINFSRMRAIADAAGAVLMVDMAHFAGLVAGKVFNGDYDPVRFADIVTTTTHKTLRGPRGGLILCKETFAEAVDKGCPLVIGGPLPHVMAAKAVALSEAAKAEFTVYANKIVDNAVLLAQTLVDSGLKIATGGTDNHLMLINVTDLGLTGRQAESVLRECGITLNRNSLPFDPNGPWYTSGLRIGTPAVTTLGMGDKEMREIAAIIKLVLSNTKADVIADGENAGKPSKIKYLLPLAVKEEASKRVQKLLAQFPVYPELDIEFLKRHFIN